MEIGGSGAAVDDVASAGALVSDARRQVAIGQYHLAIACLAYADLRLERERAELPPDIRGRVRPGEFVADELALMLRQQPWHVRCLVNRTRRIQSGLPIVWKGFAAGDVDAEQVLMIDRVARRATKLATVTAIDEQAVGAAACRSPKQLGAWLLRLLVQLEPEAFAERHRRALADRRVTVVQGIDGMGYVTGETTAADAAEIDALLTAAARSLGAADPRTQEQRRADLFADLLLGRVQFDPAVEGQQSSPVEPNQWTEPSQWVEIEDVDPNTGELLGTRRQPLDAEDRPLEADPLPAGAGSPRTVIRRPRALRVGVVVPLSSLLGLSETPGELVDRSGFVPAGTLRDTIAAAVDVDPEHPDPGTQLLFTRLLTDDGGRLLDATELGRFPSRRLAEAVRIRAGSCRHPTCTVPADQCDLDHREPHPSGPTSAANLDPHCRRHHTGKTFGRLANTRDADEVAWLMPDETTYRVSDDPLPTGRRRPARS